MRNPYKIPQADFDKAYRLYADFREHQPDRGRAIEFEMPTVLMVMGNLYAIEYDTVRGPDKKIEKYVHHFHGGSRPLLCADGKSGALFIVGGRYRVTERGIVDLSSSGQEIE